MDLFLVIGGKYGKPELFGGRKGLSHFFNIICLYKTIVCTRCLGTYRVPGQCYNQHFFNADKLPLIRVLE